MKTMLLGILCLLFVVRNSWACSCFPRTFREPLCNRNRFVIKARILHRVGPLLSCEHGPREALDYGTMSNHGYMLYKLQIEQIYRDLDGLNRSIDVMESRYGGNMCGIVLDINETYILTGGIATEKDGTVLRITGLCDVHRNSTGFVPPNCSEYSNEGSRILPTITRPPLVERRGEKEMAREELQLQERDPDPFFDLLGLVSDED